MAPGLLALLLSIGAGLALFRLPALAVTEVEVEGLRHLPQRAILSRVSLEGQNLLALPVSDVERAVSQEPWVHSVEVRRRLPGTVTLLVQEREPALVWEAGGKRLLVDQDGAVLEEARSSVQFPLLRDLDGKRPAPGDRMPPEVVSLALTLLEVVPREIGQKVRFFEYVRAGGLVVETEKGKRARFGDATDLPWKLAIWKTLLQEAEVSQLKVGHVDLRFGDRPFFRP